MVSSGHDRPKIQSHAERKPATSASNVRVRAPNIRRFPLFIVALSMATGIIVDRYLRFPTAAYGIAGLAGFAVCGAARLNGRTKSAWYALAIGFSSVGALHHQLTLQVPAKAELQPLLNKEPLLVRLRGEVIDAPTLFPAPVPRWDGERPQDDLTRFDLRCNELFEGDVWHSTTGSVQIDLNGRITSISAGDRIEVSGWASELPTRRNPGQRDVRASLLSRGLCGVLRVETPDLILVQQRNNSLRRRTRQFLRSRFEETLKAGVSPVTLPIAQAILLGDRSGLGPDLRSLFVESGTMHLLAISGLHIGIVALFLYGLARALQCPPQIATLIMLAIMTVYIDAADSRPPMIRAFVLVTVCSLARLMNRPAFSGNSLSAAALVLLAINPTTLFDVGAQLSFLAVATIMWCVAMGRRRDDSRKVDVAVAPNSPRARDALRPLWQRWLLTVLRTLKGPVLISGAIWGISAPLAAATFRILAPIGIVLNVVLIPLVGIGLCFGFLGLLLGIVNVDAATVPLVVLDSLLRLMTWLTGAASRVDFGHFAVTSVPLWWTCCFYGAVAAAMFGTLWRLKPARLWSAVMLWMMFGFVLPSVYARNQPSDLTCTFLSVGHGLSIVVETPNGRVLVYDCGSAGRPQSAALTLERFLLDKGETEIDGILVSHSDADHFNGIEQLAEKVTIGKLLLSRHFPDTKQPGTLALIDMADHRSIPIAIVDCGDRLQVDPLVSLEILHPHTADEFDSDNAASVVLQIEFAGRRILLTGDLEEDGLRSLLSQPSRDVDVLLAPHHGAIAASTEELATWAKPRFVVASARRRFDPHTLETRYGPESQVLTTSRSGAVEFRVSQAGELSVREFLATAIR